MKPLFMLSACGLALMSLSACGPTTPAAARVALDCPSDQGDLKLSTMAPDKKTCTYTSRNGDEVSLRLIPAVPFWLCNIASGFVRMPLRTYLCATVLGIIPSTFIYSSIGAGLGHVFDRGDTPDMRLLADPQVYLPLMGLALLCTGPLAFHAWRARRRRREALTNAAE